MPELICHLIGDYVLQSHVMAQRKLVSLRWAFIHALFYSLPFLLLTQNPLALAIICVTHALVDRYRVAHLWCGWWGVGHPGIWWRGSGFVDPPPYLSVWLRILVDNTVHLSINHLTLRWLS